MESAAARLALGTVQFGLPYGIANQQGQPPSDQVAAMVHRAAQAGIDTLDTAIDYGQAESVLGAVGVGQWRIIGKLPAVPESTNDIEAWVTEQSQASMQRLNVARLDGLLLHRPGQLLDACGPTLWKALEKLKTDNQVRRIGYSIYVPAELDQLWPQFRPDLVQAPLNVFDRRMLLTGWLQRLESAGVDVHLRSAFLQGLLLMPAGSRPAQFDRWKQLWQQWDQWLEETGYEPLVAALQFTLGQTAAERVVIGVDSLTHLEQIIQACDSQAAPPPDDLFSNDEQLLNPQHWT